jgi:hypothetical protein
VIDQVGSREDLARVEAHVQGLVEAEGEAPPAARKLEGREPQVEQDRVGGLDAARRGLRREVAEVGVAEAHPGPERSEAARGQIERVVVAVETEQARFCRLREQCGGMAPESNRAVDDPGARRDGGEPREHLPQQHGLVLAGLRLGPRPWRRHQSPRSASF